MKLSFGWLFCSPPVLWPLFEPTSLGLGKRCLVADPYDTPTYRILSSVALGSPSIAFGKLRECIHSGAVIGGTSPM